MNDPPRLRLLRFGRLVELLLGQSSSAALTGSSTRLVFTAIDPLIASSTVDTAVDDFAIIPAVVCGVHSCWRICLAASGVGHSWEKLRLLALLGGPETPELQRSPCSCCQPSYRKGLLADSTTSRCDRSPHLHLCRKPRCHRWLGCAQTLAAEPEGRLHCTSAADWGSPSPAALAF